MCKLITDDTAEILMLFVCTDDNKTCDINKTTRNKAKVEASGCKAKDLDFKARAENVGLKAKTGAEA